MAADIFNRDIFTSGLEHMSTVGAVVLALGALNEIENIQKYEPGYGKKITPNGKASEIYKQRYEVYLDFYHKTKKE